MFQPVFTDFLCFFVNGFTFSTKIALLRTRSRVLEDVVFYSTDARAEALQEDIVFLPLRNYIGLDHTKKH